MQRQATCWEIQRWDYWGWNNFLDWHCWNRRWFFALQIIKEIKDEDGPLLWSWNCWNCEIGIIGRATWRIRMIILRLELMERNIWKLDQVREQRSVTGVNAIYIKKSRSHLISATLLTSRGLWKMWQLIAENATEKNEDSTVLTELRLKTAQLRNSWQAAAWKRQKQAPC